MVLLGNWGNRSLTLSIKSNCITLSLQNRDGAEVYSFDSEGRLWTAMFRSVSYRRGLDGKVVAKWGSTPYTHERRWLQPQEARSLEEQARQTAAKLFHAVQNKSASIHPEMPEEGKTAFERVIEFNPIRAVTDIAHYHEVYQPVGILPPDQYMALVLQVTEGCSFNTCTFCNFYRDRPFRIKTPVELGKHIDSVRAFLGNGISLRRTIFLGDANALVVPTPRLLSLLDTIHAHLDVEKMGGIYAFLDGFSGDKKTVADYQVLRKRGLKRVYVGMESGNEALLQFLNKPGKPSDCITAVNSMKQAGLSVGVIVLLGAGGHVYSADHVRDTIDAIHAMNLDLDDILYFSELVQHEGMQYTRDAYRANLKPLSSDERLIQAETIEQNLKFSQAGGTPHISRYDIREFVY
jgi:radical SAM superfamily enzyme YgiQ (UPF0313 family)